MTSTNPRRKRRRRPTLTPRFGSSSLALEIGLIRMTADMVRQIEKKVGGKVDGDPENEK